jgi:hypothetical protein
LRHRKGEVAVVELLLARGANKNAKTEQGHTALMLAALDNKVAMVELLLRHRVDKDATQRHGLTALIIAASNGHLESTAALLRGGCDRRIRAAGLDAESRAKPNVRPLFKDDTAIARALSASASAPVPGFAPTPAPAPAPKPAKPAAGDSVGASEFEQKLQAMQRALEDERRRREEVERKLEQQATGPAARPLADEIAASELDRCVNWAEPLARGVSSTVYCGRWREQAVAVKVSHEGLSAFELENFRREAEMHALVSQHPRIVRLLAFAIDKARASALLVMRLAENGSLRSLFQRGALKGPGDTLALVRLVAEAAEAVAFLHSINILHRDLACRNVLVDGDMHALLTDLGFARQLASASSYVREVAARPFYALPPEELETGRFSKAGDVYMFGMLLWECFARGELPSLSSANDPASIKFAVLSGQRPRDLSPDLCPASVTALMRRCWAHAPGERPVMSTVAAELNDVLSREFGRPNASRSEVDAFERSALAQELLAKISKIQMAVVALEQ